MNKPIWYIHTLEYYLAIIKNELLIHILTWMNKKSIMLSEEYAIQTSMYYIIPFI
jgi:hypothetical protein